VLAQDVDALNFLSDICQATGIRLVVGVNAYPENFHKSNLDNCYGVLVDPSSLSGDDESKLKQYAEEQNLVFFEEWNDWGRFLKIAKQSSTQAYSLLP